jgi:hypothetical protein
LIINYVPLQSNKNAEKNKEQKKEKNSEKDKENDNLINRIFYKYQIYMLMKTKKTVIKFKNISTIFRFVIQANLNLMKKN